VELHEGAIGEELEQFLGVLLVVGVDRDDGFGAGGGVAPGDLAGDVFLEGGLERFLERGLVGEEAAAELIAVGVDDDDRGGEGDLELVGEFLGALDGDEVAGEFDDRIEREQTVRAGGGGASVGGGLDGLGLLGDEEIVEGGFAGGLGLGGGHFRFFPGDLVVAAEGEGEEGEDHDESLLVGLNTERAGGCRRNE
jgi:hypothetical protein